MIQGTFCTILGMFHLMPLTVFLGGGCFVLFLFCVVVVVVVFCLVRFLFLFCCFLFVCLFVVVGFFFFFFFFLGGGGVFFVFFFRKHPCLLPILRKTGERIFMKFSGRPDMRNNLEHFLAYCMLPFGSRIDFSIFWIHA